MDSLNVIADGMLGLLAVLLVSTLTEELRATEIPEIIRKLLKELGGFRRVVPRCLGQLKQNRACMSARMLHNQNYHRSK